MTSKDVIKKAIKQSGKSHAEIADDMGYAESTLYNLINDPDRVDFVQRTDALIEATENTLVLEWLCAQNCGIFVRNPEVSLCEVDMSIIPRALKEFGESIDAIVEALADGKIDKKEALKIRKEWEDVKVLMEQFTLAAEFSSRGK